MEFDSFNFSLVFVFRVLFCLGPPLTMTLKQNAEDAVHSTFQ